MMDNSIADVSKSFTKYRIKAPATGPTASKTRRLQQAVNEKENSESSVEVTAEDVLKALQQLQRAAKETVGGGGGGGPASNVDLKFLDSNTQNSANMKRRLLSSVTSSGDINAFATQLQQQVKDAVATWQRLDNGAVISNEEVKAYLASRAAGLKQRYGNLKTRFDAAVAASTTAAGKSTKRRLLEENDNNSKSAAAAPAPEMEEDFFNNDSTRSPFGYTTSTVVVLMTPADAEASTAFIDDVLNFLMDTLTASRITPDSSTAYFTPNQDFGVNMPMYRPDESGNYFSSMFDGIPATENEERVEENDAVLKFLMESVTAAAARGPENHGTAMGMEFPSNIPPSKTQQGVVADRRRRQLLGLGSTTASSSSSSDYDQLENNEDDFLDNAYADEESWLWVADDDDDWMSPEASIEEAVLKYADEANESELLDLVVKLVAPVNENGEGISPALLEILLDPNNASVAQLLKELAAGPGGGEISVAKQGSGTERIPPRFAVFGPSVVAGFGQAAAVGAHLPRHIPATQQRDSNNGNGKMVDMVVAPLRGPKPHTERDIPGGMDARWWGVVLGLGGLGLLLVGAAAVAAMKSPESSIQGRGGEDSIHGGGRGGGGAAAAVKGGYEAVPASPQMSASPWENKGQVAKVKASSGTSRKTSNLPA
jgi:hypothetical protein